MSKTRWTIGEDQVGIFQRGGIFPGPPRRCPRCGSAAITVVARGAGVHFRCTECDTATFVEHGCLWTVADRGSRRAG